MPDSNDAPPPRPEPAIARRPILRDLPSVDRLLRSEQGLRLASEFNPAFLATRARALVASWRDCLLGASSESQLAQLGRALAEPDLELASDVRRLASPTLGPVINATGVVVHTNLGRAPWPQRAIDRAVEAASGYCNLEYDLDRGQRGRRESHLSHAHELFGAEAALVVNNNAAAVFLALNSLAEGRETIVSRGELVEIGGSFRIPDILARSGSRLREVGTTNRTRIDDYRDAIGSDTAVLLKVHPSNYRILGFTQSVRVGQLAELARSRDVLVVEDLGSGVVVDLTAAGVDDEPTVARSVAAGVDLVVFSGDKLLGGPQAGFLVGRTDVIARCKSNPIYRALRPDKVTIAAVDEMLRIYTMREPWREVPVLRSLAAGYDDLYPRSVAVADRAREAGLSVSVVAGASTVGGGAAPLSSLPSPLIVVRSGDTSVSSLECALRRHSPPIVARVDADALVLDLRTVPPEHDPTIAAALITQIASDRI